MFKTQAPQSIKYLLLAGILLASLLAPFVPRSKVYANGGYPWSGAVCVATGQLSGKCPNYEWAYNGQVKNSSTGNYYYRNCTDYAAWKLTSLGVPVSRVTGLGNAGMWDNNAPSKGLSVSTSPTVSSIAVDERYGHVAFVESVSGGVITISEYNWGSTGSYGTRSGTASQLGLSEFVNFGLSSTTLQPSYEQYSQSTGVKRAQYLGTNQLVPNQMITANQYLESYNTKYVLLMQPDGNLVEYGDGFRVIWHSHTYGNFGAYAVFQGDGNLVVYSSDGRPLWNSGVHPGAYRFVLQDDGHLVTYNAYWQALWYSGIYIPDYTVPTGQNYLRPGQTLQQNKYLRSSDGRYSLIMQPDGNLVVYAPGYRTLWNSYTYGNPGAYLAVQSDGNLVVYTSSNIARWWSGMSSNPDSLIMQSDGNLVQYNAFGSPVWHTHTFGQL